MWQIRLAVSVNAVENKWGRIRQVALDKSCRPTPVGRLGAAGEAALRTNPLLIYSQRQILY